MKKKVVVMSVVIVFICLLSACGKNNPIMGRWQNQSYPERYVVFETSTEGYNESYGSKLSFTYQLHNNQINITMGLVKMTFEYDAQTDTIQNDQWSYIRANE